MINHPFLKCVMWFVLSDNCMHSFFSDSFVKQEIVLCNEGFQWGKMAASIKTDQFAFR